MTETEFARAERLNRELCRAESRIQDLGNEIAKLRTGRDMDVSKMFLLEKENATLKERVEELRKKSTIETLEYVEKVSTLKAQLAGAVECLSRTKTEYRKKCLERYDSDGVISYDEFDKFVNSTINKLKSGGGDE